MTRRSTPLRARPLVDPPDLREDGDVDDVGSSLKPESAGTDLSFREVFRAAGPGLIGTLCLLNFLDDFGSVAFGVLSPDIQDTLGASDTVITVVGTLGGAMLLLGSIPAGIIADRVDRTKIIGVTSVLLAVFTVLTGATQRVWHLVAARFGAGIVKGNLPAFSSLLTDAVPIEGRARAFSVFGGANSLAFVVAPVTAGAIASAAGGPEGWRWAFVVTGLPLLVVAAFSLTLRDPGRGRFERAAVVAEDAPLPEDLPAPPVDEAFARIKRIRTYYFMILAFCAVGVGLFVVPTLENLYIEDRFGLDAAERGVVGSLGSIGGLFGASLAGAFGDRLFQRGPQVLLRWSSFAVLGIMVKALAFHVPNVPLYVVVKIAAEIPLWCMFALLPAVTAPILPPRLRSVGFAFGMLYLAVCGGLAGSVIGGMLSDAYGEATAATILLLATAPLGALFIRRAARTVDEDIAAVAQDIVEEEEQRRLRAERPDGPLPGEPLLEVRRLDFSYGKLQVLFDVDVDVHQGEVLAFLGTNGAGKSTLLRAITGLGFPERGMIRFAGEDVTYKDPANRVGSGIVQVPGGRAIFPSRTVEENLRIGGFTLDDDVYAERRADVLELFPVLRDRIDQPAGTMSGGERQMLAIAKGLLLDPRLLCIDELSLGLAPIVVEQLIEVVADLKARGVTMLIVEQSVNVALTLADRAIFMEKGHIRFEGPAQELLERDDLVRAVFLGGEGG